MLLDLRSLFEETVIVEPAGRIHRIHRRSRVSGRLRAELADITARGTGAVLIGVTGDAVLVLDAAARADLTLTGALNATVVVAEAQAAGGLTLKALGKGCLDRLGARARGGLTVLGCGEGRSIQPEWRALGRAVTVHRQNEETVALLATIAAIEEETW
jgi:hypothetical protein